MDLQCRPAAVVLHTWHVTQHTSRFSFLVYLCFNQQTHSSVILRTSAGCFAGLILLLVRLSYPKMRYQQIHPSVILLYKCLLFAGLIPLLVRLLYPKMRKRSGRLGGKGAPGSARSAILNYLAALDPAELAPLVQLFLQPISTAFQQKKQAEESCPDAALPSSDR